jgi:hypothetical protein
MTAEGVPLDKVALSSGCVWPRLAITAALDKSLLTMCSYTPPDLTDQMNIRRNTDPGKNLPIWLLCKC